MTACDPDSAWVERAKNGESEAFRVLIRRHQQRVVALLRRMLLPSGLDHLCEDLAQETFVNGLRGLDRFEIDQGARFSTWLLRIAANLAINELRRRRLDIVSASEMVPSRDTPDTAHEQKRVAAAIVSAVGSLSPEHRIVFVLREYEGLDYAEIAQIVGVQLGTVKSRLSRARATLRDALSEVPSNVDVDGSRPVTNEKRAAGDPAALVSNCLSNPAD